MKWEKVKLGDVIDTCLGKMLDRNKNHGEYEPYLANLNVRWGSFSLDNLEMMKFEESENERYGLKYGDLVICEGGEPGRCAVWKNERPNMKIQKALHRVRPHQCLNNFYLYYWFLLAGKTGELEQYFTGATIKHMPAQKLKEVEISLPPLPVQQRIASILSAYDDLIENNQKQIKLLEEAAQRLYKEWFVDLRFPGHESVKVVDGVPEGWKKEKLVELAEFKRGKTITKSSVKEGNVPVIAGGLEAAYFHNVANTVAPVITVSASGANAGYTALHNQNVWASDCSFIDSRNCEYIFFVYDFLKVNKKMLLNLQKGSAQPHVYAKNINELILLIPQERILQEYSDKVEKIYDIIFNKTQQIASLREARDRLLPKLMNGEIEVEDTSPTEVVN